MGVFNDIFNAFFGWLIPEQPTNPGIDVTKADTNAYIPVAYGRCYGGGLLVYQATNDMDNDDIKNDLLHQVVVWSEGECGGVINNYVDDELSTSSRFNASGGLKWFYARNLTDGLFGYSDPVLAASGRRPTDSFRGKLVSYLRSEMDDGEVWRGQPDHKAEYNGRLISTPSGGALTASENPVDQLYDLLKSPIYGKGLTTAHIDVASFQAARPICETLVETYAGSGEYRKLFTSNISLDTSNSVLENVNTLLKAMRGWLFHSDGKLKLLIEKDDAPVDFNIDENDQGFIEFGDVSNSSKANRYNRVICRYTDPDSGWTKQEVVYPAAGSQEETDLLAEDNGVVLEKSISLDTCIYYHEAAHHAKTILEVSREQLRTSVTWGPEAVILEVGDIVPVTRSALGWNGKLFRIESTEKSTQDGTVQLKLREHQPYIYDDANMGDKPVLPDTSIAYDTPSAPSAPVFTDVYNDFAQVKVDWTSSTTDHRIVIKDSLGNQVLNSTFAGKSFSFENFAVDTYTVKIYAIGGLGRQSTPLETSVTISSQATPTASPTVTSKPGFITVAPPLPTATKYTYEWRWSTSQDATLITGGKDIAKTIADVIPDVTYTIEYRLITPYSEGAWESVDVNGVEKLTYIWYVYADDNIGTGISTDPTGKAYFGIVGGKASPTVDITDPTIFDYYIQPDGGAAAGAGITAQVTKENILINTDSSGNNGDFTGANSTFSVLAGSTDDTNNWTVQATDSASVTGSLSGHTYTVTALSADTGTITFTATRTSYPTLTKVVSVAKVKDGSDGSNGVNGSPGADGVDGADGADGLSAYQIWLNQGNSGTEADFLADLNGNDGIDGNTWHEISSGAPSNAVGVNNDFALSTGRYVYFKTGGSWVYQYDLKGVDGAAGNDGLSAYEVWLADGNSGTEADFLSDLNGNDGIDGNTWHEVASGAPAGGLGVNDDFALSEGRYVYYKTGGSWVYQYDLEGPQGEPGMQGPQGPQGNTATLESYAASGTLNINQFTPGGWVDICSFTVPAGLYRFIFDIDAEAFSFNTTNTIETRVHRSDGLTFAADSSTGNYIAAASDYDGDANITGYTYTCQAKRSNGTYDSAQAAASASAQEK